MIRENIAWLEGYLMSIAVIDGVDIKDYSYSTILCHLNEKSLLNSFIDYWTSQTSEEENESSQIKLTFEELNKISEWENWLKLFLEKNILKSESFTIADDKKDYMIWNVMEMIVNATSDYSTKFIYTAEAKLDMYSGYYIFIPCGNEFIVMSFLGK